MRFQLLDRKNPIESALWCVFILVIKNNLGLAELDLKTHVYSTCINGVLQISLIGVNIATTLDYPQIARITSRRDRGVYNFS